MKTPVKANVVWLCLAVLTVSFSGCREGRNRTPGSAPVRENQKPVLVLSILPQKFFASRIGGDLMEIQVLAGPGQNPHNYDVSPRQMQELARASVWITSGVEFEITVRPKIAAVFPRLKIIDGVEGLRFRALEPEDGSFDDDEHEHSDLEIDRHTWLGPEGAKLMAARISDCLCALDEANAFLYRENCAKLIEEIEKEFEKLKKDLIPLRGRTVFVYHPSFGYFLDEFGIIQEAVETGGREPTPRQLGLLIEKAREEKAKAVFVQSQFPAAAAGTVASAIGAELVSLDPLAEDWLANIRLIGDALRRAVLTAHDRPDITGD